MQEARGGQRITPVVAGAGNHRDVPAAEAIQVRIQEASDLPAGDFHQLQRLDPEPRTGFHVRLAQRVRRQGWDLVPGNRRPGHVTRSVSPGAACSRSAADPSRSANSIRPLLPTSAINSFGWASS